MKSMKKLSALALCALIVFTLCACSPSSPAATTASAEPSATAVSPTNEPTPAVTEAAPQPITITFWYCYTDKIQENNINLTKQFNETVGKDMGITVNAEYQGDYPTMSQKLKAAFVAGTAPAVTVMDTSMLAPYAKGKILQPLDSFIARDKVDMKDFQPAFLTDSTLDGATYSLPYLRSTPILYLNTTLLAKAGLDPKGPATWDELVEYAKTVKEKTGKFGFTYMADPWVFQGLMMAQGSSVYNEDATATNMNSDAAKTVVKRICDMRDNGSTHILASTQASNLMADITSQNCAMWFHSTGGLTTFIGLGKQNGFEVTAAFMPKGIQYACPSGGANLVMTSKISNAEKEAAWQFINWMTQKNQTITASATTGYLPTRISAVNDPKMQELYAKVPSFKVALDQLPYAGGRTVTSTEGNTELVKALDAIWVNKQDIDKTLSALQTKMDDILKQQ